MKVDFLTIARKNAKQPLTEQEESYFGSLGQAVEEAFTADAIERNKKLAEIEAKVGTLDEGQTVTSIIRAMATKIDEVEAAQKPKLSQNDIYRLKRALEKNKEVIQRASKSKEAWAIEFKAVRTAAAVMTSANMVSGTVALPYDNFMEDPELMVIQYPKNFVLDTINSKQVTKVPASLFCKYETAQDGTATVVTHGAAKPLIKKNFAREYFYRAKYAGRIEYEEEMEMDFEQLLIDVTNLFQEEVIRVWNDAVLALVTAYASAYTSSSLDGTMVKPDVYGVIMAGMAWGANNNYTYDQLYMNPADYWSAKGTQDLNGNYVLNPFTDGFAGLQLTISNKIAAGELYLGTKQTIKEQHGSFILRSGQYADQLIENEYTIIGEVFSVTQLPTIHKPSWLKLNIAAVKQLLAGGGA